MISARSKSRFWSKIDVREPGECWPWKAARTESGYGKFGLEGRGSGWAYAHRVVWQIENGPIPADLEVDHTCRHRECVNLAHLELVTHAENMRRQARATDPTCQRGHLFDGLRDGRGRRVCRTCRQMRDRLRRPSRQRLALTAAPDGAS